MDTANPGEPHIDDRITEDIKAAYDAIDYDYASYPQTHPDRLATIAALHGVEPAPLATARILEVGCGDGMNLMPIADLWPDARIVGIDLAPRPVARGQAIIRDLGLANIELRVQDLRQLPASDGDFDYIIAHGFYSWVPQPVRDALMAMIAARLSPNGVAYVSYNALPGSYVRKIAWDAMNFRTQGAEAGAQKVAQAREFIRLMAEPGRPQYARDALLRDELADTDTRGDSALMHDDMAVPNQPFYFHEFMAHATQHGLTYLGDAEVGTMTATGLSANVRRFVAGVDRLAAEQYLDFARFRRFRQTLLTKAPSTSQYVMTPARVRSLQVAVAATLVQQMNQAEREGRTRESVLAALEAPLSAMVQWLVARAPAMASVEDIARWRAQHTPNDSRKLDGLLAGMYVAGLVQLYTRPAHVSVEPSARPVVNRVARRWSLDRPHVVNLRHEAVNLSDVHVRRLVPLLDGSRDRRALLRDLGPTYDRGADGVEAMLRFLAKVALLEA